MRENLRERYFPYQDLQLKNKGEPPGVKYNGDWVTEHLKRV